MAVEINPRQSGPDLASMDAASLRKLWSKTVTLCEQEEDFFKTFEGNRTDACIATVYDTAKGAGQQITFTTLGGFYGQGKHGSAVFETANDYEKLNIKSSSLVVDWIRNGYRHDLRMEDYMGMRHELVNHVPENLGRWEGRLKTWAMWMMFRAKGGSTNRFIGSGRATQDALVSADTLSYDDIVAAATILKQRGAKAAFAGRVGKNIIKRFIVAAAQTGLRSIKTDPNYLDALQEAGPDAMSNLLFTGGYADVDGHMLVEYDDIDHGEDGPTGSVITPRIRIKDAITTGNLTFDITGGTGDTNILYTQAFPNHDFKFNASDVLSVSGSPTNFYVAIVNPANATTDPGKIGFYRCSTNNGNKITVNQRLGASISGIRHTTVGDVVWDTGVWSGKHTVEHPAGAMAYLCNSKGVPIGWSLVMGANAARRGYGQFVNHRATDEKEGGFINESYLWTVFGQNPVHRMDGEYPNFMLIQHAIDYAGVPFPTVT